MFSICKSSVDRGVGFFDCGWEWSRTLLISKPAPWPLKEVSATEKLENYWFLALQSKMELFLYNAFRMFWTLDPCIESDRVCTSQSTDTIFHSFHRRSPIPSRSSSTQIRSPSLHPSRFLHSSPIFLLSGTFLLCPISIRHWYRWIQILSQPPHHSCRSVTDWRYFEIRENRSLYDKFDLEMSLTQNFGWFLDLRFTYRLQSHLLPTGTGDHQCKALFFEYGAPFNWSIKASAFLDKCSAFCIRMSIFWLLVCLLFSLCEMWFTKQITFTSSSYFILF